MNGLANAILTLLLSWLKTIISSVWSLLSSESGSRLYRFLAENWLLILLVLAVGGFVVDRIIYVIRWRPYWVRRNRRLLRQLADEEQQADRRPRRTWEPSDPVWEQEDEPVAFPGQPVASAWAAPAPEPAYAEPWPAGDTRVYGKEPAPEQTNIYAGPNHNPHNPQARDIDPVFDDEVAAWDPAVPETAAPAQPAGGVSLQYIQDMHAGFARPLPPEQLYPSGIAAGEQVHPGLDEDAFRRHIGLDGNELPEENYTSQPVQTFTPFTKQAQADDAPKKSRNPFLNLMKLMGDDDSRPTIHDLKNTVDVRTAFHDPVFPQQTYHTEEDA
jgi:hypothetical protein